MTDAAQMGFQSQIFPESLPNRIVIRDFSFCFDGGTFTLIAIDDSGHEHYVTLATPLWTGSSTFHAGRLYFDSTLVPMRSELEGRILKLLSDATIDLPPSPPLMRSEGMAVSADLKKFFESTPDDNARDFVLTILERVQSDNYLRFITGEEKEEKRALAEEANREAWERPSGKKKRRTWERRRR
jgi:hypothetical protein